MKKPPAYSVGGSSFVFSTSANGITLLAFLGHLCTGGVDSERFVLMATLHDGHSYL